MIDQDERVRVIHNLTNEEKQVSNDEKKNKIWDYLLIYHTY